jgi:acetylornithine deacetylase/succinyl-diaminopimelate desuccinylase-like protein
MLTTTTSSDAFDSKAILNGIRRGVEIETPTEAPGAETLAAEIGFELMETFTAGGSDGNFTAPHAATPDGLGVVGQRAHTHDEQMYISSIGPQARLVHRLYQTLR